MTTNKLITLLLSTCLFFSCEDSSGDFANYNNGKKKYDKNCQSCHNISNITTYHPSLLEMQSLDVKVLKKQLKHIKYDKNHRTFLVDLSDKSISQIIYYITHYQRININDENHK